MAIQNKTPNYGLPLPQGNEVMAYQDFINEPMQIIDTQMKANADGVAANKADLVTANQNISEVDGKVAAIQANLAEWNVPGIIEEQGSMGERLTAVEKVTGEFVHPDVSLFMTSAYDNSARRTIISGGCMWLTPSRFRTSTYETISGIRIYYSGERSSVQMDEVFQLGSIPGNVFSLPILTEYYIFNNIYVTSNDTNITLSNLYFRFNGSETTIYGSRIEAWDNKSLYVAMTFPIPLGIHNATISES